MHVSVLVLWILSHVILLPSVFGLARHSRFKKLPFFFSYLIFEELSFGILLLVTSRPVLYQWVAIVALGVGSCLQLAVFYEIVNILILPRSPVVATLRSLIRWTAAVTILLAVGISAAISVIKLQPLTHILVVLNFSANLINLGLLLILLAFTRAFRISWMSLPAGVALGFGISSSGNVGATSLLPALGMNGVVSTDVTRMVAFLACVVVWVIYIFLPETRPNFTGHGIQKSEIEVWQQELDRIARQ